MKYTCLRWAALVAIAAIGCSTPAEPPNTPNTQVSGAEGCPCGEVMRGHHGAMTAGHGEGCGHGPMMAGGRCDMAGYGPMAGGYGPMGALAEGASDRALFHFLLDHRASIRRTVKMLPDGVETLTESDDPEIAQKIHEHVQSMRTRMEEGRPIHARDPLFAAVFASAGEISMSIEETPKGVKVVETSKNPRVVQLIQAHADVVTKFLEEGHAEMRKDHPVPPPRE